MRKLNKLAQKGEINENASIKDSHSTIINADINKIWSILVDVENWTSWNPEVKKTTIKGSMKSGTVFEWTIGKTHGQSQAQQVDNPSLLSWTSKVKWIKRIFVWSLESHEHQTIVTVSTSLQGTMIAFVANHQRVYNELLNWLECLRKKAEE